MLAVRCSRVPCSYGSRFRRLPPPPCSRDFLPQTASSPSATMAGNPSVVRAPHAPPLTSAADIARKGKCKKLLTDTLAKRFHPPA
eukprot:758839-Hanusia_phi.AAC.1